MGVMKRLHAQGERCRPIAGQSGMYSMSDMPGAFHWAGTGPAPFYRFEGCEQSPYWRTPHAISDPAGSPGGAELGRTAREVGAGPPVRPMGGPEGAGTEARGEGAEAPASGRSPAGAAGEQLTLFD